MKVCVVGAGAAGLCAARHLLATGATPVILERSSALGGTWVYTDTTGYDDYGLPVHTSMYKSLRTNLPKEIMGFPDFPIPENKKSYLPAKDMVAFLQLYSDHHDVTKCIKYNHLVKMIKPSGEGWVVQYQNLNSKEDITEKFDAVMVCNGHYNTPYVPKVKGMETFEGEIMHSHDYRVPEVFTGRRVLVIGAGPSGMDIALEIAAVTQKVLLSHHLKEKPRSKFPDNLIQKPDVAELSGKTVTFKDGSKEDIDAVFFCTGYLYNFPFLDESCGIRVEENFVQPLYKHMINIEHPTMCLVGIPYYVCAFSMFDLQVRFFVRALKGYFQLPSKSEMYDATEVEFEDREQRGFTKRHAHMMGPDQEEYYNKISEEADLENLPSVMTKIHNTSSEMFLSDLTNFRDYVFKENYYKSLSDEAGTENLPSVLTKIREESSARFLHNLQYYREDIYKIIDDDTYAILTNGKFEVMC